MLRFPACALVVLSALGLAGCTSGPNYRKPELHAPAAWYRLAPAANRAIDASTRGDLSHWWRGLNDPLLSDLVELALRQGLDLRKARARLREARARLGVADAARFPDVEATASASRSRSIAGPAGTGGGSGASTSNQFSAGFDASWELDVFGSTRRGVEAARADQGAAEANLDATRVALAAEVARNYVEVRSLQSRLGIARTNLTSQSETLQLTEFRAQAGLVSVQDVQQARSNCEQTRAQLPTLELSLAEAEHRLDILLGEGPGTLHGRLSTARQLPRVPSRIAVGIPADTLRQRPDVRAAERKLAAETARLGAARAARSPSFRLSGSIGLDTLTRGVAGSSTGLVSSLLGGLTAPSFDAGRLKNQARAQDAVQEQSEVAYEQAVLTALQDVESALVALARHSERREVLAGAVEASRTAAQLARQRYGAGLIDFQSVLDSERTVLSVEDQLANTRADELLALIRLYKALGGGWSHETGSRAAAQGAP